MSGTSQCENCGALLVEEDVFCGECGAPRPIVPEQPEPAAQQEPPVPQSQFPGPESIPGVPPEPTPAPVPAPAKDSATGWRVTVIALIAIGAVACISGLMAFLLFGSIGGDTTTVQEDWLFSAVCCLLPIGGAGAILLGAGAIIWYVRLRNRPAISHS
jgi:hypothetical protein